SSLCHTATNGNWKPGQSSQTTITLSPEDCQAAATLGKLLKHLHADTARELNGLDNAIGRHVWFNVWDTRLTYERSAFVRLTYVHQNAVKHGLVAVANQYRWCSAAWLERTATPAQVNTLYGLKIDRVRIEDDFQPV